MAYTISMKAITIKNPHAEAICLGVKDVENRSWRTSFRGRVFIHSASKSLPGRYSCPNSAIIGSVEIIDCVLDSKSPHAVDGYWHWILRDPELFEFPILNIRGSLSFWTIPEGVRIP